MSGAAYHLYRLRQTTDKITAYSEAIRSDYFALMNEYWGGSDRWSEADNYQSRAVWVNEPDQKTIVSLLTGNRRLPQTEYEMRPTNLGPQSPSDRIRFDLPDCPHLLR